MGKVVPMSKMEGNWIVLDMFCGGLLLSLPGMSTPPHYGFSLTPGGSPYLAQSGSSTPHQGVRLNLGGILYLTQSGLSI